MSGSIFGKLFCISTFGESHGDAIGVIIDGCPSNISLSLEDIMKNMEKRKPGNAAISTSRKEADAVEILSGIFEGKTTGTPIALVIRNTDQRSHNYDSIKDIYRPSHGDYPYSIKYGIRDYRGGGRASARETAARVAAGSVAKRFLEELGITVTAYTRSIGPIIVSDDDFNLGDINQNILYMPNNQLADEAINYIQQIKADEDSIGGIVECTVRGLMPGIGEPVFDRLDSILGQAIMSINAVKAFEIGSGVASTTMLGSEYNDSFYADKQGHIKKHTNHSGGTLAGLSDGSDIVLRAHFKPTPSIAKTQSTINTDAEDVRINITGRHDPTVVPRGVVVVEAMAALAIADLILQGTTSNISQIKKAFDLN
ncbi:MAG: chorismate synthase [Cellulosilyticaceae bacterium]